MANAMNSLVVCLIETNPYIELTSLTPNNCGTGSTVGIEPTTFSLEG